MGNMSEEDYSEDQLIEFIRSGLANASPSTRRRVFEKFALAALGSIPWVGGFISAAVSLKIEEAAIRAVHDAILLAVRDRGVKPLKGIHVLALMFYCSVSTSNQSSDLMDTFCSSRRP